MSTPPGMDLEAAWVICYSTVVGWQYHPRVDKPLSLEECAKVADEMVEQYAKRRSDLWQRG